MKSKVFIRSSKEALRAAEAILREVSHDCEPMLWSQGIFRETNACPWRIDTVASFQRNVTLLHRREATIRQPQEMRWNDDEMTKVTVHRRLTPSH
jgi:hypothetical protein